MKDIPVNVTAYFNDLLIKELIDKKYHGQYRKWLRYYLDFCMKYKHSDDSKNSLSFFIKKLQEKNQTQYQQDQAKDSVTIYYKSISNDINKTQKNTKDKEFIASHVRTDKKNNMQNKCL